MQYGQHRHCRAALSQTPTEKFRYKRRGSNFCNNFAEQVCELRHDVVQVERLPLGMAYPEQS
jgi:hypothetical protein